MFLLKELILASPLLVYVWVRLCTLIERRILQAVFTVLYALVLTAYPAAESMSHGEAGPWASFPMLAGYSALPLLLYLGLTVVLTDASLAVLRLSGAVSRETVGQARFRRSRFWAMLVIPAVVVAAGAVNYRHLRVQKYAVDIPRRASAVERLRIVFAADFHLGPLTSLRFMEEVVDRINALDPDIVLVGGDVLEGDRREERTGEFAALFRRIRSKHGIYAAPGNHESHRGSRDGFFERAGITLLADETVTIDRAFSLIGRNDARSRRRKTVDELLGGTPGDLPVILIDHRPTDFGRVSRSRVDIQLSGHTHHGQLFPLNLVLSRLYVLSWGYLQKGRTHFFVTSGLQVWGPPVRTAGATEIVSIDVALRDVR